METRKIENTFSLGSHIDASCKYAVEMAIKENIQIEFEFNEITCVASPTTDPKLLSRDYMNARYMGWETIGPDCSEYTSEVQSEITQKKLDEEKQAEADRIERKAKIAEDKEKIMKKVKGTILKLKDKEAWESYVEKNSDDYGGACISYAELWALMMQHKMKEDKLDFKDFDAISKWMNANADKISHEANIDGITGFMYGAAVQMLSQCWLHGELLRKWHNKEYDHEGEGVVNPAIVNVGVKED